MLVVFYYFRFITRQFDMKPEREFDLPFVILKYILDSFYSEVRAIARLCPVDNVEEYFNEYGIRFPDEDNRHTIAKVYDNLLKY